MQSFYVDQRPVVLRHLGLILCAVSVMVLLVTLWGGAASLFAEVARTYQGKHSEGLNPGFYLVSCVQKASCREAYLGAWALPVPVRALFLAGASLGFALYLVGRGWRPELVALRGVRLNSLAQDRAKGTSPTAPKVVR